MSQAHLAPMMNIAVKAARAAGAIINRASMDLERLTVTSKGSNDFVTEVDQAAEAAIIDTLLQAYPGHGILAEESGRERGAKDSEFVWIIDPLDGTTNFIHGLPIYSVSIALMHKGRIEHAVVYDPSRDDLFHATRGRGAFLNNRRLRVSKRTRLLDSLIGTGFPFRRGDNFKRYLKMFEEVMAACAGVRRPGSAALDLCYLAAGWYDGFFETGLSPWDCAAGSLIVTEAGGLIGNFTGEADFLFQREVVAGNPKVYGQLVQMLAPYTRVIKMDEAGTASTAPAAEDEADAAMQALAATVLPPAPEPAAAPARKAVRVTKAKAEADAVAAATAVIRARSESEPAAEDATPARAPAIDIPMTPAQALAAAFEPTPVEEGPAPVVVRKTTRIRKADLPPAPEAPAAPERRARPAEEAPVRGGIRSTLREERPAARPARDGGYGSRDDRGGARGAAPARRDGPRPGAKRGGSGPKR